MSFTIKLAVPNYFESMIVRCNTLRTESNLFYEKINFKEIKQQKIFEKR
jgi:hypothetical protein